MTQPIRIQRSRQKMQFSPNGLPIKYCGRPSVWGNPFRLQGDMIYVDASHRRKILDPWVLFYQDGGHTQEEVVQLFSDLMMDINSHPVEPEIIQRFRRARL